MDVVADAEGVELILKLVGGGLSRVAGHDHAVDRQPHTAHEVDLPQQIEVVADAEIGADLVLFDVVGADAEDNLCLIRHRAQQTDLRVRLEAGQHPRGVVVVEQLAAEFEIQLAVELAHPLEDVLALLLHVQVVIEAFFHTATPHNKLPK